MTFKRAFAPTVAIIAALVFAFHADDAEARGKRKIKKGVNKALAGKIITSNKRIPTSAKSQKAYTAKLKKMRKDRFIENKEKKEWKIYYAAFMKKPVGDLEVTIKLYDVTDGRKRVISSFEQYLSERGQMSIVSYLELERQYFEPNRKILMTVETYRGQVLASGTFRILGEVEKFSGKVDFTEEETKE